MARPRKSSDLTLSTGTTLTSWAETLGARDIFVGANALDYSGYPDCRPEYFEAFTRMADLATRAGVGPRSAVGNSHQTRSTTPESR